jgi:hypothetical protein
MGQEAGANFCQLDATAGAFEKALAEVAFQGLDAGRNRRLGQKKSLRRPAEAPLICHLHECFKLSQVQSFPPLSY